MYNQKYEEVLHIWRYSCQNGYDGPDWIDVDSYTVLCKDSKNEFHLYMECIYDEEQQTITTSFDIGFNPLYFLLGLDDCIEELIQEYVLTFELQLSDRKNWYDDLDELEQMEVKMDLLKHMRDATKDRSNYIIDDIPIDSKYPFRVWFLEIDIKNL